MAVLSAILFAGMPSGLAAFLQADSRGWRVLIGVLLGLLSGFGLVSWAAFEVPDWHTVDEAVLDRDPRVLAGGVLGGVMVWALFGAALGKVFEQKVEPMTLGLRTAAAA